PLSSILGFGELLLLNEPKTLSKEQIRGIENIITAGQYLLALVTQVMEMSRIEANELQVNMEPVPAEEIIVPCLSIIGFEAQAKGIAVVHDCGLHAKWAVWTDRVLVKQVLLNLISNAVNFNRNGGTITVTCQPSGADFLRICVADTGVGIAISRRDELFEPFARLGAEAGRIQGAGLGLATSKRLIEGMRGRIGYESTEGVGSVFWIELPLAEEHPEASLSGSPVGAPQLAVGGDEPGA
ncbi:MAG: HAMP domain-containing sensor histidine kinase, partial [Proteobacteria bacterium]|nr:HAMP domain-containing sensor histidine kinase [Pseudomonadota bacterium]